MYHEKIKNMNIPVVVELTKHLPHEGEHVNEHVVVQRRQFLQELSAERSHVQGLHVTLFTTYIEQGMG